MGLVLLVTVVIFFVRSDFQRALCYDKEFSSEWCFFVFRCCCVV